MTDTDSSRALAGIAPELEAAREAAGRLEREIRRQYPDVLTRHPVDLVIDHWDAADTYGQYGYVPQAVGDLCRKLTSVDNGSLLGDYQKLVLMTLIATYPARGGAMLRITEEVRAELAKSFRRIIRDVERNSAGFYDLENDLFLKDLGICRLKLIPCGAFLVDRLSGIPRSSVGKGSIAQGVNLVWFVATRLGGFKPVYEMHMDKRLILRFNPKEWEQFYRRLGRLIEANPGVRGTIGSSWWFDPQLEVISPGLTPLRTLPQDNGAHVFSLGEDGASVGNATANSLRRRKLYEEGRYKPQLHMLIWGRRDIVRFARSATAPDSRTPDIAG